MRKSVFALLVLLAAVTVYPQPQLFVVEAKTVKASGEEVRYFLLEWNSRSSLMLPVHPDTRELVVRVDSGTPFKPHALSFDGTNVTACHEGGVTLIEDFIWINFTRLDWKPRVVTVYFGYSEPKSPIYALSERGEKVWGHLIEALCSDASALKNLSSFKVTILSKKLLRIQTSMGEVSLWDVTMLRTGGELGPLLDKIHRTSIEVRVKTLYYDSVGLVYQPLYLYVNAPPACSVSLNGRLKTDDVIGRAFPGNPALYAPSTAVSLGSCSITVVNPGSLDYSIAGALIPARSKREVALAFTSLLRAEAYRGGVKTYMITIHGLPSVLELPSYAYNVKVSVTDSGGKPVDNATVILLGTSNTLRETCRVTDGKCFFSDIPSGAYIVAAYVGEKEVGRTSMVLERSDGIITLRADLNDFEVAVLYPTGEKMAGYTVSLHAYGLNYESEESQGRAFFNDVPSGLYSYAVVKDGAVLASGVLKIEPPRSSYVIIANVSKVFLKVIDFLGKPYPQVSVQVKGAVSVIGYTDEKGTVAFDLPFGEYEVEVREIRLSKRVSVRNGGEYFVLSYDIPSRYFAVAAIVVVVASFMLKTARRKKEEKVEVLDLEFEEN